MGELTPMVLAMPEDMLPTARLPALTLLVLLLPLPLLLLEVMPLLDAMSLTLPELSTLPRGLLRLIPTMPPMAMVWAMLDLVWAMLELTELTPMVSAMPLAMPLTAPLPLSTLLASPPLLPLLLEEDMLLLDVTVPTVPVSFTVLRQLCAIGIL